MRRFNVYVSDYHGSGCYEYAQEYSGDGDYVDADEALAELEKLRADNEALRVKLPRWVPFNHNDTGIWGLLWVRMEGPEFDIDVDSYGAAISVQTGRTITKTLLGFVEWDGDCLPNGRTDYYPVVRAVDPTERDPEDTWTITHYARVLPPAAPEQEPAT